MFKTLLLSMFCTYLVLTQASIDEHERVKNRVVHVETLLHRGRWLWQNDYKDADGSRFLYIDLLAERDTYYEPRVQFQATECGKGKYLCFESLSLRDYYLTAGYPAGSSTRTVKLQYSVYTEDDDRFHWKVECEDDDLERCQIVPLRFGSEGSLMVADDRGHDDGYGGGHYDATLGRYVDYASWFRVHAPNPTDGYNQIYKMDNTGTASQQIKYSTMIGISQTETTTQEISESTSVEVGGAFKAFSASVSTTIESSWQYASSTTYEASKTVTHILTIPPRTTVVLKQLIGHYAGEFDVGDDQYEVVEIPMDGGDTLSRKIGY